MKHLSYKMCCELRDAGFPQECEYLWHRVKPKPDAKLDSYWAAGYETINIAADPTIILSFRREVGDFICGNPNLEELIEATTELVYMERWPHDRPSWRCAATHWSDNSMWDQGNTPAEAVARLWLALNKDINAKTK